MLKSDVNSKYRTTLAKWFQGYREQNNKMKTHFKLSLDILKQITQSAHVPSSALGGSIMGMWRSGLDEELISMYENIHHSYGPGLIEELEQLIALLDEENEKLANYFNSTVIEDITSLKEFERICINYNQNKRDLVQRIYTKIPNLVQIGEKVHGIHEQLIQVDERHYAESAQRFVPYYVNFASQVLDVSSNPEEVLINLIISLNYLGQYFRESENNILEDFAEGLIQAINSGSIVLSKEQLRILKLSGKYAQRDFNSQITCFLTNYFKKGVGKSTLPVVYEIMQDLEWSSNAPKKSYNSVNAESKKLDLFLKSTIKKLFNGVAKFQLESKGAKENWFIKNIDNIVKLPSNTKELKETLEALIKQLDTKIREKNTYRAGSGGLNAIKLIDADGEEKSIKEILDKKFIDDENNKGKLLYYIRYLEDALTNKDPYKDNSFKNILERNVSILIKVESSSSGSENVEFNSGAEFKGDMSNISRFIEEAKGNILGPKGIEYLLNSLDSLFNENGIESVAKDTLNTIKNNITYNLSSIGRNLKSYKEHEKVSWGDDDFKLLIDELKILIDRWSKNITKRDSLEKLIEDTKHLLKYI